AALARSVDQRMDGRGAVAALAAHHRGGLAGEGREFHFAVDRFRDVLGEGGLAGPGVAEQAKHLRGAVLARPGLEPGGDGAKRGILLRGKDSHHATKSRSVPKK